MYFGFPYLYSRISEGVRAMVSFINGKVCMMLQNDDGKKKKKILHFTERTPVWPWNI